MPKTNFSCATMLRRQRREDTKLASLQDAQYAQMVDEKGDVIVDLQKANTKHRVVKFRLGKQLEQQQAARIAAAVGRSNF
jgi:hypothetical protein